jgi:hypothetical protein
MSRKKCVRLVPLIAITAAFAAFAVIPATTQAVNVPRVFVNGSEIEKGNEAAESPFPVLAWGTLTLSNAELGLVTCENIFSGKVVNPVEKTLPAEGTVEAYQSFNCTAPTCETAGGHIEISPLGNGENITGKRSEVERIVPATKPLVNATSGKIEPGGAEWTGGVKEVSAGSKTYESQIGNKEPALLGVKGTTTTASKIIKFTLATETKVGEDVFTEGENFTNGVAGKITKVNSTTEVEVENAAVKGEAAKMEIETTAAKHRIRFRVGCHAKAVVVEFHGELHPKALNNGTLIGAAPSELEFAGPASGTLESSPAGGGTIEGKLKGMGYEGGAVIKIKSI